MKVLEVENLKTFFKTDNGVVKAVRDISFFLEQREILGIVGESGSGKSVSMFSILGLLARNGYIGQGRINFDGQELLNVCAEKEFCDLSYLKKIKKQYEKQMTSYRGKDIGIIFQDPMTYLNPILTVGYQMSESLKRHFNYSNAECKKKNKLMLETVGITNAEKRLKQYPFELSGGMRQRVMIAMALTSNPRLLIADEPTTALDVTIQAQILELMKSLQQSSDMSIILITHDLGVVASMCTRIIIMYGGQIMEEGTDREIFYQHRHPYTSGLLKSIAKYEENREDKPIKLVPIEGSPPDLLQPPQGCAFVDRCEQAMTVCKHFEPQTIQLSSTHRCKCFLCYPQVNKLMEESNHG
ncbi:MAG: ABC transporter ATP-binding protein [Clostridiales bacterium]